LLAVAAASDMERTPYTLPSLRYVRLDGGEFWA
jgi:hypothetical protein